MSSITHKASMTMDVNTDIIMYWYRKYCLWRNITNRKHWVRFITRQTLRYISTLISQLRKFESIVNIRVVNTIKTRDKTKIIIIMSVCLCLQKKKKKNPNRLNTQYKYTLPLKRLIRFFSRTNEYVSVMTKPNVKIKQIGYANAYGRRPYRLYALV